MSEEYKLEVGFNNKITFTDIEEAERFAIYEKGFEAGQKAGLNWQDISSAPKDGSLILLANSNWERKFAVGSWELHREGENIEDFYYWYVPGIEEDYHADCDAPTSWLPLSALPPAPEVKDE